MVRSLLFSSRWLVIVLGAMALSAHGATPVKLQRPAPKMSYLDNGVIRLGVDLSVGGAITYLSLAGSTNNIINSHDYGRQIQMSYYSGPHPFEPGTNKAQEHWKGLGWNPIQTGDCYLRPSQVLEHKNTGKAMYVKCIPMHWPLNNVPGECTFESWLELEGAVVHARCRLNNARPDKTQYRAHDQECPAVYVNGPYYRLMTYTGDKPFTSGVLSRIEKKPEDKGPWASWHAAENWAALVDEQDWGLGVWNYEAFRFIGGFAGKPGRGGPLDGPTGYIAPLTKEILDHNIVHDYRYDLILGKLAEIRKYVYGKSSKNPPPTWRFERTRQGWHYVNAEDDGWPVNGELKVKLDKKNPQLIGPESFWLATQAPVLVIEAACQAGQGNGRVFWRPHGERGFSAERALAWSLQPDGQYHTYRVNLAGATNYTGAITQLRLDPPPQGRAGDWIKVRGIKLGR